MPYNPFDKAIRDLTAGDLDRLIDNEVTEGYGIEYKGDFPENKKVGRSIASLANAYGGWYFIGVAAD